MELQIDINKVYEWSQKQLLEFDAKECHLMKIGKSKRRPWDYKIGEEIIMISEEERGLEVFVQDTLTLERYTIP